MSLIRSAVAACALTHSLRRLPATAHVRYVKRWVGPTLRELKHRSNKLGPQAPQPRSGYVEWNYRAEMFAFGKRLNEEFQLPLLEAAFTSKAYVEREAQRQRELGIEDSDIKMTHNEDLSQRGVALARDYINGYLQHSLVNLPAEGREAIAQHLCSTQTLSNVASHLGMKELLLTEEYPPTDEAMAHALLAVIGALEQSSDMVRSFGFIRDFICTQLNQLDLMDVWKIDNAEELLAKACEERKLPAPEARLIGDCGKNTILSAYQVGIYVNKQMIGKGFGEDIKTAIEAASLNALQKLYGIGDNMKPFNFQIQVEPKSMKLP